MEKLVKLKSTNKYIEITDVELANNPALYVDRSENPIYWLNHYSEAGFTYFRARNLVRELYLSKVGKLDDFRDVEKDALIAFGIASKDMAVAHLETKGYSNEQAEGFYAYQLANHISNLSSDAREIIVSPKILLIGIKYLTDTDPITGEIDTTQIDNFVLAIRGFLTDYERYNVIGSMYGDRRDGIADYYSSTGSYTSGGLKNYTFNPKVVTTYGGNVELVRLAMIDELDNVFVRGNK